jgi:hypothetical protein
MLETEEAVAEPSRHIIVPQNHYVPARNETSIWQGQGSSFLDCPDREVAADVEYAG